MQLLGLTLLAALNLPHVLGATPFMSGVGVIVSTCGTGNLHLLSYQSNGGIVNHVGTVTATSNHTRFLISHSYTFERFAFYWDGDGRADATVGTDISTEVPVGTSWANASLVAWGGQDIGNADVSSQVGSAVVRNNEITAFILP